MHLDYVLEISACAFAVTLLSGCGGPSAEVTGARRAAVERWVTADHGYRTPLKFDSVWYSQGFADQHMVCGQFDSPPEFGGNPRYIRFIYDFQTGVKQVEMHRLWATGSGVSQAIIDQNRKLFDDLWKGQCAGFHP
ncbi:hypothetical protein [Sphingomonas sp. 22176]|uniref:hypothetical protein n=1 Tax=Sphingomonas sp. 22176 TaxID=3453884 RepID=UPI003F86DB20